MYEQYNQQGEIYIIKEKFNNQKREVYIIKEKGGKRQVICGNNPELMPGILIKCVNLTRLDVLKYSDYSLQKKTLENK